MRLRSLHLTSSRDSKVGDAVDHVRHQAGARTSSHLAEGMFLCRPGGDPRQRRSRKRSVKHDWSGKTCTEHRSGLVWHLPSKQWPESYRLMPGLLCPVEMEGIRYDKHALTTQRFFHILPDRLMCLLTPLASESGQFNAVVLCSIHSVLDHRLKTQRNNMRQACGCKKTLHYTYTYRYGILYQDKDRIGATGHCLWRILVLMD